jgi:GDP-4-dehydro-6-deoxy-D-mannose reductase
VGQSWEDPIGTVGDNVAMTAAVLEAVRLEAPDAVVITVGSGEEYGPPEAVPTTEDAPLRPQNPYAVSKASSGLLARFYADAHGLRVIHARAFNHSGPGQAPIYAIANFAQQVAAGLDAGENPVRVVSGSPDTRRDYTDVRDIVRAYRLLAEHGEPGVYNVCSGVSRSARELIAALGDVAGVAITHEIDPAKVRAHEVHEIRGSAARMHAATGWTPEIPLERTLADTLASRQARGAAFRSGDPARRRIAERRPGRGRPHGP